MNIRRTFDLLERYRNTPGNEIALAIKRKDRWHTWSPSEYIQACYTFAYGLLELGLKKGDKIITATNNRPEWNIADHGMSMCGIIHVPVYSSLSEEEYSFITSHSEARMVIVSDKRLYDKFLPGCQECGIEDRLLSFDKIEGVGSWELINQAGSGKIDQWKDHLEEIKAGIGESDFASLLYTSGTTGQPKGVMLSHGNFVRNFIAASGIFMLSPEDKYLSILPLCHVGGRMGNYQTQYSGAAIYYAESMGTFARTMKEIQADGFDAVPRILEKVYDNIIAKGKTLDGIKKKIFFRAVKLGHAYDASGKNSWWYRKRLALADKMIFSKWREALGGKVRIVGCGGASLQPGLEKLFWASGVKVINMYGLTETSPIITISSTEKGQYMLGTVGSLIDGVELKIADDGEILCRGHNVMLGYYKDKDLTDKAFDSEGWFHTGDIGHLVNGKFLAVTDRKKEIFKLSNGKFIAPQLIENRFKQSLLIDNLMITGEHKKFASAVISPDFEHLGKWADSQNVTFSNREELICMPEVQLMFQEEINKMNKSMSDHERLVRFRLVPQFWSPESGELSPTLKLKRKVISEKYGELIDSIYIQ